MVRSVLVVGCAAAVFLLLRCGGATTAELTIDTSCIDAGPDVDDLCPWLHEDASSE